jgi:hypothetical protein
VYVIETRDARERWHRPRLPRYISFAFAARQGDNLLKTVYTRATAFRVRNAETGEIEYTEVKY